MNATLAAFATRLFSASVATRVLGASLLVAGLTALARLVAVGRDLLVAGLFGLGDALDTFFIALMVYQLSIAVFMVSFAGAFTPSFVAVRETEGPEAAARLLRGVVARAFTLLVLAALVLAGTADAYLPLLARGFPTEKLAATRVLLWQMAPFLVFSGMVALWGAVINAGRKFALPALSPALNAAVSIATLLTLRDGFGVAALALGLTAGAMAEAALLGWAVQRQGLPLLPAWRAPHPRQHVVLREYGPAVTAAALMALTVVVDQAMATWLGPRAVSAYNLGTKMVSFVLLLGAGSLSTAAMPFASRLAATGGSEDIARLALRLLPWVIVASAPVVAILVLTAQPLVALVFERGAFDAQDTALVADVHAAAALQIPFYVMNSLLVRLLAALNANRTILLGTLLALAVKIAGNLLAMEIWGVAGIMLTTTLVHAVLFGFLWWRLHATRAS
jgi:putative peptidoglycan lipid II flippase